MDIDGKNKNLAPQFHAEKCPVCNGFGTLKYGTKTCQACRGLGYILVPNHDAGGQTEEEGNENIK